MRKNIILFSLLFFLLASSANAKKRIGIYSVAFYNVENLFDTEYDEVINDRDYTPEGANAWTEHKYWKKQRNIATAISRFAKEHTNNGPAIIGLAEVENRKVVEDLVKTEPLASTGYKVVHYDSPDRRGIDVALIYNPELFQITSSRIYPFDMPGKPYYKTRDQLLVSGILAGEHVHVIVGHWPSRWGGASYSSPMREHAAAISKHIADSLLNEDMNAKVIIMGDLNDNPDNPSVAEILGAKRFEKDVQSRGFFNTMWDFYANGIGSLGYQGKWSLFDQIIISESLVGKDRSKLQFWKAEIFNREFLMQKEGRNKGYPHRTFQGPSFINGYSDHFPTMIYLVKEIE